MGTVAVDVKWQKEVFKGVEIDMSQPPIVFKNQLFSLTGARHLAYVPTAVRRHLS
jgi:ubiquitin carboxyl-terminal hydrolase 14